MKHDLSEEILKRIDLSKDLSEEEIHEMIDTEIRKESKWYPMEIASREKLHKTIFQAIRQLGILQELIENNEITEIMVNGTEDIFIERKGKLEQLDVRFESKEKLTQIIWQITADCNRVVNDSQPIVDARLPDGARVNVVLAPVAINGPILTIRRFPQRPITMKELLEYGTLTEECRSWLAETVEMGCNLLVCGGTGSGKTTFLNVLSQYIPAKERVITIEDSAELQIQQIPNLVRLETRNANVEGCKEITIRELIRTSLRMRPDRIIVGEVRGKEAIDMLQSVNVGHSAMTTVHANSAYHVISRLETMVLMGMDMPILAIRRQIVEGFDVMIHLKRCKGGRRIVAEVAEPLEIIDGQVVWNTIFKYNQQEGLVKVGDFSEKTKNKMALF